MSVGWISLHRSIKEHWVFNRDDYFKAWVTVLMEVNHKEKKTLIKGKLLTCTRGESLLSHQSWADRFGKGWNRSKVIRFFNALERDKMIEQVNEQVTTRLSVCNYSKFQYSQNQSEHQSDSKRYSKRTGDGTQLNNDNKGISKESTKTRSKFKKPTVDEIKKAVKEKGYSVNPVNFFTFYESKDWMIGKNKMKSWEHALANWQSREKPKTKTGVQW